MVKTRVDIVSTEIEEQREWLQHLTLLAIAAAFCLSLGLILLTLFIVVLFWDSARLWVLGGFSVLYLGGGIVLAILLKGRMKAKPRFLSSTSAELARDYNTLQPNAP